MFGQYANQWVTATTPLRTLMQTNVKTISDVALQQKSLFCGLLDDGIHYLQQVSQQPELDTLMSAGHQLTSAARERLAKSSQASLHSFTELKNAYTDTLGNTLSHLAHPEQPTDVAAPQTEVTVAPVVEAAPVPAPEVVTEVTTSFEAAPEPTSPVPVKKTTARTRRTTKATPSQKPE